MEFMILQIKRNVHTFMYIVMWNLRHLALFLLLEKHAVYNKYGMSYKTLTVLVSNLFDLLYNMYNM